MFAGIVSLASCGSGGSGGNSGGGGQQPDPVVVDFPIAYIERTVPTVDTEDEDNEDPIYPISNLLKPTAFFPGARVIIKDRASALATEVDITKDVFKDDPNYDPAVLAQGYDVKDLSVSPDGKKLLFAMHPPLDPELDFDDPLQTKWHVYEYDLKTKAVPRPIITSKIVADQGHDISPSYLPDGRIIFSSTRQTRSKAILLDDGKPQFSANEERTNTAAFELHVMKDDGTGIEQITYNQSHDLQPSVTKSGRILYTHWDHIGQHDNLSFYTANPDGSQVERHYGYLSMNVKPVVRTDPINRLLKPQEMLDGRIAAILKPDGALLGGDMVVIDTQHFYENTLQIPAGGGTTATAQNPISILPINIKAGLTDVSTHGRFSALSPLYDGTQRLLVSWSQCRLKEIATNKIVACTDKLVVDNQVVEGYEEAEPFYGIWIYNMANQSQLPIVLAKEGKMFTEPVTLEARPASTYTPPKTDPGLAAESVGVLHIRSVYEMDGQFNAMGGRDSGGNAYTSIAQIAAAAPDARPARFVRLIKAVSVPDEETRDNLGDGTYGEEFNDFTNLREVIAYVPVEPDGSVMVKVPADVAFTLEVLDKDGKRIGVNHNNWLQIRPGETRTCNGCHVANNLTSGHGRSDAELASINTGAASAGSAAQFPGTKRVDKLGAPIEVKMGETMAELAFRSFYQLFDGTNLITLQRQPTVDLVFDDEWTEPVANKAPSFAYRYTDLTPTDDDHAPTSAACMEADGWTNLCRVIINYEQHVQPLWDRARPVLDSTNQVIGNNVCTSCHSNTVTDAGGNTTAQIPAGYLELIGTKQAAGIEMLSYTQLLTGSNEQFLDADGNLQSLFPVCSLTTASARVPLCTPPPVDENGAPTCAGVAVCQYEQDAITGALLLDSSGNLIPRTSTEVIPVAATMSRGGARASARFFNKFTTGSPNDTFSHVGLLNTSEQKLLSEWLDLGGQYYNNPFDSIAK